MNKHILFMQSSYIREQELFSRAIKGQFSETSRYFEEKNKPNANKK
jgi:hypothetical protein